MLLVAATACGGSGTTEKKPQPVTGVFFGAVGMTTDRVGVAVDAPSGGKQHVRVFVTDGSPTATPSGSRATSPGAGWGLTSVSGKARIDGTVEATQVNGTITLADGQDRHFHTIPATHGAGIYDVTVAADGHYTGTSTDGPWR